MTEAGEAAGARDDGRDFARDVEQLRAALGLDPQSVAEAALRRRARRRAGSAGSGHALAPFVAALRRRLFSIEKGGSVHHHNGFSRVSGILLKSPATLRLMITGQLSSLHKPVQTRRSVPGET